MLLQQDPFEIGTTHEINHTKSLENLNFRGAYHYKGHWSITVTLVGGNITHAIQAACIVDRKPQIMADGPNFAMTLPRDGASAESTPI